MDESTMLCIHKLMGGRSISCKEWEKDKERGTENWNKFLHNRGYFTSEKSNSVEIHLYKSNNPPYSEIEILSYSGKRFDSYGKRPVCENKYYIVSLSETALLKFPDDK